MIEAVVERCAGIDVGRKFVMVCVMVGAAQAEPQYEIRQYATLTESLEELRAWLHQSGCTHVVMESTGSYWKPVFNVLDDGVLTVILANSQQVKNLRGHKTDRLDSRWLAHLLRHDMIRPSFIPPRAIRELRDLTRRRKQLVATAAEERNRVQKVLQEANVQIGTVLSDVFGASGLEMLDALVNTEASAAEVADQARGGARKKIPELQQAIAGHRLNEHTRSLIRHSKRHLAFLEEEISELDGEIATKIQAEQLEQPVQLLTSIPGIQHTAAAAIVAETGADMSRFPEPAKLASWTGVCPGNHESAGKRHSGRTTQGNPWLRRVVVECAWSATRKTDSMPQRRYQALKPKIQHKRALVAVAHWIVLAVYDVLRSGRPYENEAGGGLTTSQALRAQRYHTHRLTCLHRWLKRKEVQQP